MPLIKLIISLRFAQIVQENVVYSTFVQSPTAVRLSTMTRRGNTSAIWRGREELRGESARGPQLGPRAPA